MVLSIALVVSLIVLLVALWRETRYDYKQDYIRGARALDAWLDKQQQEHSQWRKDHGK